MNRRYLPALTVTIALMPGFAAHAQDTNFAISTGYRSDALRWNIAGDPTGTATPNILSELTWENLRAAQLGFKWQSASANGFHARTFAAYGWIYAGRNQDSDYLGNDRTLEFSRSNNTTDGDALWDLAVAMGYRFTYIEDGLTYVTPMFGLSHHGQNLRITDGNQTIPATGSFPDLNSTYHARWNGPWLGIEIEEEASDRRRAFLRLEYHVVDYRAEADWNLRSDFAHPKSFAHEADGEGIVIALGFHRPVQTGRWTGNVTLDYQRWEAGPGIDRVFFADGTTATTRLNEVVWTSWSISLGLQRRF